MNPVKTVAFYTLGCKLNFSESSAIARSFEESGYARVDFYDRPDILVINTCSVTENADKKCKKLIQQARSVSPHVFIAVIGCYAQLKPEEISQIPGVNLVLGASEKFDLPAYVEQAAAQEGPAVFHSHIKEAKEFSPSYSKGDRTRSFMKIQDGCDYFCSFCTIPLARGRSRSNSVTETVSVAQEIAATDIREIVLTGVNIGDFGKGRDEDFLDLIRELDKVQGIDRYRISSIEPNLLSDKIIDFVAGSQRFVPHFHVPLQSGSDKILQAMRRRYLTDLYRNRIEHIKAVMPDCCIGVDVIVGYPGETAEDFLETYHFLNDLDVSYLHVFTYSERNNTVAVRSTDVVPMEERRERSKMLRILSEKKKRFFYEQQTGKEFTALFESENIDGYIHGFTENYIKVRTAFDPSMINCLKKVKLVRINADGAVDVELIPEKRTVKIEYNTIA